MVVSADIGFPSIEMRTHQSHLKLRSVMYGRRAMGTVPWHMSVLVFALLSLLALPSCVSVKTRDNDYPNVLGKTLRTKDDLRLYPISYNMTGDDERYWLTQHTFISPTYKVIAVLPPGHEVTFEKLRFKSFQGEDLLGTTVWKGRTYPVTYHISGSDSLQGEQQLSRVFVLPEG